jgi:hypothetical protein
MATIVDVSNMNDGYSQMRCELRAKRGGRLNVNRMVGMSAMWTKLTRLDTFDVNDRNYGAHPFKVCAQRGGR